jgi:hypothetical protein
MNEIIKEVNTDNIEYINEQKLINKELIKQSTNLLNTEDDDSSKGMPSVMEVIGVFFIIFFIITLSIFFFTQAKETVNLNNAIQDNTKLYTELVQIKDENKATTTQELINLNQYTHTLSNSNFKSVWGGEIIPSIDKDGTITINYDNVPVEYCEQFIYKQKLLGWNSVSIASNKGQMKSIDYKNESEVSRECSKNKTPIQISFKGA